nr:MAG TPA: hypothetical protein [Caudoviricetes sp.]
MLMRNHEAANVRYIEVAFYIKYNRNISMILI